MRTKGTIFTGRDLSAGDHVCWSYSSDDEHRAVISSFFAEGIERGERIAYFAPVELRARLPVYVGSRYEELSASGQLVELATEEALVPGAEFDSLTLLRGWEALTTASVDAGYRGLRAAGEAGWLLERAGLGLPFTQYEFRADLLVARVPLTALCCYDLRLLDHNAVGVARALHPLTMGQTGRDAGFSLTSAGEGTVMLAGEIDQLHAARIGTLLAEAARDITELELSGLQFVDVTGFRALAEAAAAIDSVHGRVRFTGASDSFQRTWILLGLDARVDFASPG